MEIELDLEETSITEKEEQIVIEIPISDTKRVQGDSSHGKSQGSKWDDST